MRSQGNEVILFTVLQCVWNSSLGPLGGAVQMPKISAYAFVIKAWTRRRHMDTNKEAEVVQGSNKMLGDNHSAK